MKANKITIFSLTTSYLQESSFKRSHFVHVLNVELAKLGINVQTITPHVKGTKKEEIRDNVLIKRFGYLPESIQINSSSIQEAVISSSGRMKLFFMFVSFFVVTFFECLKQKPDILHGHWAFPGGYIASVVSKFFGKKCIVTIHGSDIPLLNKFKLLKKIVINNLNKSSLIIANSDYAKNELIKMGIKSELIDKIRVPPDFVEHQNDRTILNEFKSKFTDSSSKVILFVGRLVEVKGVEYLIKAIPEMKISNIHLIIVGDGPLKDDLEQLTSSLDLDEKITFFGKANSQDLGLLHGISDVLVCPSIIYSPGSTEGLPMVIPEAMESGIPVIGSGVGGIVDVVKNEVNGLLVKEKEPKSIATALERILLDDDFKQKLVINSKETVKEFQPSTVAKKYLKIFQNLSKIDNANITTS